MSNDQTREKILEVATVVFGKYGFRRTTMDEIARYAHKAKGSVYYYFKSKEDLFTAVVERELRKAEVALEEIATSNLEIVDKLKRYMNARIQRLVPALNYHETLKSELLYPLDFVRDVKEKFYKTDIERIKVILKEGVDMGVYKDIDNAFVAELIEMVLKGLEIPFFLQNIHVEMRPRADELFVILLDGLLK